MEDKEIIDLFCRREEAAIQALSGKYFGYCYKIAWNLLENREDAEECLNDTWYAAWRRMPPHRPNVLSAFVGKITREFAIDSFRKNLVHCRGGQFHSRAAVKEFTTKIGEAFGFTKDLSSSS